MEERIVKIEQDIAKMTVVQESMEKSIKELAIAVKELTKQTMETRLLEQKIVALEARINDSFKRQNQRIEELENIHRKITWLIVSGFFTALIGLLLHYKGI